MHVYIYIIKYLASRSLTNEDILCCYSQNMHISSNSRRKFFFSVVQYMSFSFDKYSSKKHILVHCHENFYIASYSLQSLHWCGDGKQH